MPRKLYRARLAKSRKLWYQPRRRRGHKGENVGKTGQGNRRGVSFHLILQILPERCRTSSDGKTGHGKGKKKRIRENGSHDNDALVTGKIPFARAQSPPYIPGVRLTRSCTVTTGKRLIKRGGFSSVMAQVAGEPSRQFFTHYCVNWGKKATRSRP